MKKYLRILFLVFTISQFAFVNYSQAQTTRYVKAIATGTGNGSSWANASADVQLMINNSSANDQVWVASGTYLPNRRADALTTVTPNDRDNAFVLKADVKIYGGFAGTETALTQRDLTITANASILSADLGTVSVNSDNAYHVVISSGTVVTAEINGFTITGGNANISSSITVNGVSIGRNNGGGIYNNSSSPVISNVRLSGNSAISGGGMYNIQSSPSLRNSIIYGNSTGISNALGSNPVITFSMVQELPGTTNGNIDEINPKFINPQPFGLSTAGDYRLQNTSPLINKGDNTYFVAGQTPDLSVFNTDLAGNTRIQKGKIDLGAYETSISPEPELGTNNIVYVKASGAGTFSGEDWANATDDLQAAMNVSGVAQIWVAGGTYLPNRRADALSIITPNDRDNAFVLKADVKIYGGFAGTETTLTQRDLTLTANASILSGDLGTLADNTDNAYHVLIGSGNVGTTEINGFTITGGNANTTTSIAVNSNSVFRNSGGGIHNNFSSPIITNVIVCGNNAANIGGGIFNYSSSPIISNVNLIGNSAIGGGGGILNTISNPIITNATLSGNNAANGGGIYNIYSSTVIRNSIIYGNSSGVFNNNSTPVISYSMVQGLNGTANGNISEIDPLFSNAPLFSTAPFTAGDYRLQNSSPLINKGNNVYYSVQTPDLSAITTDLAGNPRFFGLIDMGAYELQEVTLPVNLLSYTAKAVHNTAQLAWSTASESNNKQFIISRSDDGINFISIGTKAGVENSKDILYYTFQDLSPVNRTNYYRLQQEDLDGKITDHGISAVDFSFEGSAISIYPNPAANTVYAKFSAGVYHTAELMNVNGVALKTQPIAKNDILVSFDLLNLPNGVYMLRLTGKSGFMAKQVVKH